MEPPSNGANPQFRALHVGNNGDGFAGALRRGVSDVLDGAGMIFVGAMGKVKAERHQHRLLVVGAGYRGRRWQGPTVATILAKLVFIGPLGEFGCLQFRYTLIFRLRI